MIGTEHVALLVANRQLSEAANKLSGGSACNLIPSWFPHHMDENGQFHASASLHAGSADEKGGGSRYDLPGPGRRERALGPTTFHLFSYFSVV
jgi:hypothetical protein